MMLIHDLACDPDWLRERYRFDAKARCKELEAAALNHFHGRRSMRILDVGAGLGANTRYYGNLLACDQEWILVEKDLSLARNCLSDLSRWAECNTWDQRRVPEGLEIRQEHTRMVIHMATASMRNLGDRVNLSSVDLATANAVFDLLSKEQLFSFLSEVHSFRVAILATLNYRSMRFHPQEEEDLEYVGLYERHMRRRQDFGFAMGPDCSDIMITRLEEMGYEVRSGKSIWIITSADRQMLRCVLSFMRGAISEMLATPAELAGLERWISNKLDRADRDQLKLLVGHMDIFGRFPEQKRLQLH